MYKDKKILGIITARGGSKSIPKKNIKNLCGKPLISYTNEEALKSKLLTRVIASTDDEEIADVCKRDGVDVPFLRPKELAQDNTPHIPVLQHSVLWLKDNESREYDYIMILQPTSPLRIAHDIDEAIKKAVDSEADSVMSMVELTDFDPKKIKKIEDEKIFSMFEEEGAQSALRQDGKKAYKRNCAIYLTKTDLIMNDDLFGKISRPYIMPAERSIDINEPIDFVIIENIMKNTYA